MNPKQTTREKKRQQQNPTEKLNYTKTEINRVLMMS